MAAYISAIVSAVPDSVSSLRSRRGLETEETTLFPSQGERRQLSFTLKEEKKLVHLYTKCYIFNHWVRSWTSFVQGGRLQLCNSQIPSTC